MDQQVAQILDEADDLAAERVLDATAFETHRGDRRIATSAVRAFGGMVKAAGPEWLVRGTLTRDQVETLLTDVLVTVLSTARSLDNAPER